MCSTPPGVAFIRTVLCALGFFMYTIFEFCFCCFFYADFVDLYTLYVILSLKSSARSSVVAVKL